MRALDLRAQAVYCARWMLMVDGMVLVTGSTGRLVVGGPWSSQCAGFTWHLFWRGAAAVRGLGFDTRLYKTRYLCPLLAALGMFKTDNRMNAHYDMHYCTKYSSICGPHPSFQGGDSFQVLELDSDWLTRATFWHVTRLRTGLIGNQGRVTTTLTLARGIV